MTTKFWDDRYGEQEYVYGREPNEFFKESLKKLPVGKILLPAEGEGRNAVHAASHGWDVYAFDQSTEGKHKAMMLASDHMVRIDYRITSAIDMDYPTESFDVVALIYANFTPDIRPEIHQRLCEYLKPGGYIIFESFSKSQLEYQEKYNSGGPKRADMLFDEIEIRREFDTLEINEVQELETELKEGAYHHGPASVIRFIGKKIGQ
jgi:2-polyprenyl-3-methyl-5-hydroxy-6-metoxy-1,4-benzoquinol methylase